MEPRQILLEPRWQIEYHWQVDCGRHRYHGRRFHCNQSARMLRYRTGQTTPASGSLAANVRRMATARRLATTATKATTWLWPTILKRPLWWLRRPSPLVISSSSSSCYSTSSLVTIMLRNRLVDCEKHAWYFWETKASIKSSRDFLPSQNTFFKCIINQVC